MPNTDDLELAPRKLLPIIYVIDTSGSMTGQPITMVNQAMQDAINVMKEVAAENADAEIKVGVLEFSSGSKWITPVLESLEDFIWTDMTAGGITDLGSALDNLNKSLSKKSFLKSDVGFKIPVIIFMSDGAPNDNWEKALTAINSENKWYTHASKIAIAIGDDADHDVLTRVVGNSEAVIGVTDLQTMKKLIRVVSATASLVASNSRNTTDTDQTKEIVDKVTDDLHDDKGIDLPEKKSKDTNPPVPPPPANKDDDWD